MQCDYRQRKADDGIAATLVEMTRWMAIPQGVTQAEVERLDRALTLLESQPAEPARTIRRLEPLPYPLD